MHLLIFIFLFILNITNINPGTETVIYGTYKWEISNKLISKIEHIIFFNDYKNIDIYYIGYMTIKYFDYVRINSANPLYIIIDKADGSIGEKNGNKYLIFASTDKNKEVLTKYKELWDEIKYLLKTINGSVAGEYGKEYMEIKFNSDDDLTLNKVLKMNVCMNYKC